jgi:hypothetical protein
MTHSKRNPVPLATDRASKKLICLAAMNDFEGSSNSLFNQVTFLNLRFSLSSIRAALVASLVYGEGAR